jgi:hypothetical protein
MDNIIGMTIVVSILCSSMVLSTSPGSNIGGDTEHSGNEGSVEHGRLEQESALFPQAQHSKYVVNVEHFGSLLKQRSLGEAGSSAGVHEDCGVLLFRLRRHDRLADRQQVLVAQGGVGTCHTSVRLSTDDDHLVDSCSCDSSVSEDRGELRISEDHP